MLNREFHKLVTGSLVQDSDNALYMVIAKKTNKNIFRPQLLLVNPITYNFNDLLGIQIEKRLLKSVTVTQATVFVSFKDRTYYAKDAYHADLLIRKIVNDNDELKNYIINIDKRTWNGILISWYNIAFRKDNK